MARKEFVHVIEDNASRDFGKTFIITEMSALDGHTMAQDIFRTMGKEGYTGIPDDVISMGCAGLATLGVSVLNAASKEVALQLRSALLSCVKISIENDGKEVVRNLNAQLDIEEISTINKLLDAVFDINFSFFLAKSQ